MKTYDKAAMIADFLAEMSRVEDGDVEDAEGIAHNHDVFLIELERQVHDLTKTIYRAECEEDTGVVLDAGLTSMGGAVVALLHTFAESDDEFNDLMDGFSKELYLIADRIRK
jgi:hypothetical protein